MGFAVLFSRPYRTRTMLVSVPWFLMDIATYGVGLFTPLILGAIHLSGAASGPLTADFVDAKGTAAIDLFLLIGFLVGLWAVPRFGRLHMQVVGFAGMTLGMLILLFAVLAGGGAAAHVPIVFAGFILFNLAMNAGPNATTFALAPELFPTGIRASAAGFAAATAKVGATLGIFVLPQVKGYWGLAAVLVMMAAVSGLGAVITAALARQVNEIPEGRGLDEAADRSAPERYFFARRRSRRRRALLVEALDLGLLAQLADQFGLPAAHQEGLDLGADLVELRHRPVAPVLELDDVPAELRAHRIRHLPRVTSGTRCWRIPAPSGPW